MWISPLRNYSRIAATLKRFLQLLLSQLDSQSLTQSSCKPPTWQHWEWAATPALDQPSSAGIHRTASLTSFRQGLTQEGWLMLSSEHHRSTSTKQQSTKWAKITIWADLWSFRAVWNKKVRSVGKLFRFAMSIPEPMPENIFFTFSEQNLTPVRQLTG